MAGRYEPLLVVGKYALFQIPGIAFAVAVAWWAHRSWGLPAHWAIAGVAGWILKDAALFPFVRHAYAISGGKAATPEIGSLVVANERIDPCGYVRVGAELWRAELQPGAAPLAEGDSGRICGVRGLTLLVEPEAGTSS